MENPMKPVIPACTDLIHLRKKNEMLLPRIFIATLTVCLAEDFLKKANEFKRLDDEIFLDIHDPATLYGWDKVLEKIDFYVKSLENLIQGLHSGNTTFDEAERVWNKSMPRFIYQDLDPTMYIDMIKLRKDQLDRFHKVQDFAEKLWDRFGDIVKTKNLTTK